jgi:NitT/TauT family transport system substrate-binding protein
VLRHLGLKRTDVVILQLGGEGTRTAAMLSGQIDGSLEQEPRTAELVEKGYRVLADGLDIAADYPNTSYVSTRAFIQKNPDVVKRFMMGISDGIHAYKTNKPEAMKLTAAFLKTPEGPALSEAYDIFTQKVYPDIPRPSLKGIGLVLAELATKVPAAAKVKPEQLVYTGPLDQLEKEGFFAKLK